MVGADQNDLGLRVFFESENKNKTAGSHRHIFSFPTLLKMLLKTMKAFFPKDSSSYF